MDQSAAWLMIRRRAAAAGIHVPIGNHAFRATGITAYLNNGGALEHAHGIHALPGIGTEPLGGPSHGTPLIGIT